MFRGILMAQLPRARFGPDDAVARALTDGWRVRAVSMSEHGQVRAHPVVDRATDHPAEAQELSRSGG